MLAASLLYLLTLDDGLRAEELIGGDLITHQYAQVQGRPSNAPGYPLYTMGGWLWFRAGRLLLGADANPIPILSSYSTLWALLSLALLYSFLWQETGGDWPLAFLCAAFYGVTYFFWYYAVTTEQYTSAVLHTLGIVWLAFRWERTGAAKYLLGLAFLAGLALAHMVTVLLVGPPLAWLVLMGRSREWLQPRRIGQMVGGAVLPLVSYLYVYVRGAQHPEWRGIGEWAGAWDWFVSFLSIQQGRDELTWTLGGFTDQFPALIGRELTPIVIVLGLVGIAFLGRRLALFLYGTLLLYFVFCYIDRYGNWFQVIMPAYPLLVIGLALFVKELERRWPFRWVRPLILVALLALVGERFVVNLPRADSSHRAGDDGLAVGWAILADRPEQRAAIFATREEALALDYLTQIWGIRPDVRTVTREVAQAIFLDGSAPLYVTRAAAPLVAAEISAAAHLYGAGVRLIRVRNRPDVAWPTPMHPLGYDAGHGLRLLGFDVTVREADRAADTPRTLLLSLYWQAVAAPTDDVTVSVRVVTGEAMLQQDQPPVAGHYPTSRWQKGEVVRDDHVLALPEGVTPQKATLVVYRRLAEGGFDNLAVVELAW